VIAPWKFIQEQHKILPPGPRVAARVQSTERRRDWAESDVCSSRSAEDSDRSATWCRPASLKTIAIGRQLFNQPGNHERSKWLTSTFTYSESLLDIACTVMWTYSMQNYRHRLLLQWDIYRTSLRDVLNILDAGNASSSVQTVERRSHGNCVQTVEYSDTSANEDNSFRNRIR
jgi:hypothetical protein